MATVKVSLSFCQTRRVCDDVVCMQWKEPGDVTFKTISPDHFAMAVECQFNYTHLVILFFHTCTPLPCPLVKPGGSEYADGWPVVDELLGDLPSNHLQSHARVQYIGDTIYPSMSEFSFLYFCVVGYTFTDSASKYRFCFPLELHLCLQISMF